MDALAWADLEFTGLNPGADVILEIASVVTDSELNVLAEGPVLAIHQPDDVLDAMDEWNTRTHGESGLVERVRASSETVESAEAKTLEFLKRYCKRRTAPLCGNSVHVDRLYIRKYMPGLHDFLHYRNVDVSTVKELVRRWYPELEPYEKEGSHRALEDIMESIGELRFYRDKVFR